MQSFVICAFLTLLGCSSPYAGYGQRVFSGAECVTTYIAERDTASMQVPMAASDLYILPYEDQSRALELLGDTNWKEITGDGPFDVASAEIRSKKYLVRLCAPGFALEKDSFVGEAGSVDLSSGIGFGLVYFASSSEVAIVYDSFADIPHQAANALAAVIVTDLPVKDVILPY